MDGKWAVTIKFGVASIANPTGLMLSAAMLLDHVDQKEAAARLRTGIFAALANPETRTGDLGGKGNTATYTDAVIRAMV